MKVRRILKTSGALALGQIISVGTQLVVPPIFLHSYGVTRFGEWLTLTAAVSYLGTLNFGLQTFANNHVGISYNRGELEDAATLQATAFGLLLSIVGAAALLTLAILTLPLSDWLHLQLTSHDATLIIYLLGLQVLGRMIFGFLAGSFLAAGVSYRGTNWNNLQTLASLVGTAILAFSNASFVAIAALQCATIVLFILAVAADLRHKAAQIFPNLARFRADRIKEILRPSGYFAMLFSSNFLVYQLPVIAMQRILGPEKVVIFSLTRTIYSMSRQILNSMSFAIGPEIVELYGQRNWQRLLRLYDLSERIIFALVPVVSVGTFLATPVLIAVWVRKPELYDVKTCLFMAAISAVMGTKEHKYQFQTSSNQHSEMARFWFASYIALVILSLPAMHTYGVSGFLALWLITELAQLAFVLKLNRRLFEHEVHLNFDPVYRLGMLLLASFAGSAWLTLGKASLSLTQLATLACIAMIALSVIAYPTFRLSEMSDSISSRFFRRIHWNSLPMPPSDGHK